MNRPYIIVAGLGRCGTTLVMHMLHAAGVPCIGEKPAFEVDELNHRGVSIEFLRRFPGHALKLLDPHMVPLPSGFAPAVVIWLDRDPHEQACSQAKFAAYMFGVPKPPRATMRRWAADLRHDRGEALRSLRGFPTLSLRFETIISNPHAAALQMAALVGRPLDCERMAAQVMPRTAACAPGLEIELKLLDQADAVEERPAKSAPQQEQRGSP